MGSTDGLRSELLRLRERCAVSERKLREAEYFVQRINTISESLVHVLDLRSMRNVFINQGVNRLLGYESADLDAMEGKIIPALLHPEDRPRFALHLSRVRELRDDEVAASEYRLRHRSGGWHWFETRDAVFARDPAGGVMRLVGTATPITARKSAQLAMHGAIERFRRAAEEPSVALFRQDSALRYLWAHGDFAGFAAGELIGRRDRELFARKRDAAVIDKIKRQVIRSRSGARREIEVLAGAAVCHYDLFVAPVLDGGVVREIVCAAIDISERRRAQSELPLSD
jgi:PAS domain S-box-containing protein